MKDIVLNHNGIQYKFRLLRESDADWLNETFAEPDKPIGMVNFKERISNFDNYSLLAQTLTMVMFHLLVTPFFRDLEEFEKSFGITYADIAELYHGFNACVGNTTKDIKKASKLVQQNRTLRKENQLLKYKLFQEKTKNLKNLVLGRVK